MKIKKKEYYKEIDNAYWNGARAGINFTLQNPKEAEQYKDNIEPLRVRVASAVKVLDNIGTALGKMFSNMDKE